MGWSEETVQVQDIHMGQFFVSLKSCWLEDSFEWVFIRVYGLHDANSKNCMWVELSYVMDKW